MKKSSEYSEILKSWNLKEAVENVEKEIQNEKKIIDEKRISNKRTKDYDEYVNKIKENIEIAISRSDQQSNQSEELSPDPKKMKSQNPGSDCVFHF